MDNRYQHIIGNEVKGAESKTGTLLSLSSPLGTTYNYASADVKNATTYTFENPTVNGFASALINAPTEPTVSGATKITGADFVPNTNMELVVESKDGVNVRYFFLNASAV